MTTTTDVDTAPPRRVAPALLGVLVLLQVLSNLVLPGLGISFVALLWWRRARLTRSFGVVLIVVAVLSAAFLAVAVADVLWGPQVGYQFG